MIKALEFLSIIPMSGVEAAARKYGGFWGIIPKSVPLREAGRLHIRFKYRTELPPPQKYPKDYPPVTVEHDIELGRSSKYIIRVVGESITFNQVLAVAQTKLGSKESNELPVEPKWRDSSLTLKFGKRGSIHFHSDPPISKDNLGLYLEWFGMGYLKKDMRPSLLRGFIPYLYRDRDKKDAQSRSQREIHESLLDPTMFSILSSSRHANMFKTMLRFTRRYDLLLNELRTEQPTSDLSLMSPNGQNMPTVLRLLNANPDQKDAIDRLSRTFGTIAPYIESFGTQSLRSGKEYVEFIESSLGRGVESWESSDGSLRALAILLALETHLPNSTILIEEPEQNLHPWAIRSIMEHIREIIKERNLQVIISTHSQQVLECVNPDEVLVVTRSLKQGTKFKPLEDLVPSKKLVMGEIGDMWVKGLLGGVPSDD